MSSDLLNTSILILNLQEIAIIGVNYSRINRIVLLNPSLIKLMK